MLCSYDKGGNFRLSYFCRVFQCFRLHIFTAKMMRECFVDCRLKKSHVKPKKKKFPGENLVKVKTSNNFNKTFQ